MSLHLLANFHFLICHQILLSEINYSRPDHFAGFLWVSRTMQPSFGHFYPNIFSQRRGGLTDASVGIPSECSELVVQEQGVMECPQQPESTVVQQNEGAGGAGGLVVVGSFELMLKCFLGLYPTAQVLLSARARLWMSIL